MSEPLIDRGFTWLFHRWRDKAEAKVAAESPRWAEIEQLRHTDRHTGEPIVGGFIRFLDEELGWDEWKEQKAIFDRIVGRPWWEPVWRFYQHHLMGWRRVLRWRWQRSVRGWSDHDVWGLDHHLATVIAQSTRELAKIAHGWPGEPLTFEEWQGILIKIAEGFEAAIEIMDNFEHSPELDAKFDEGFALFQKYYFNLWD